MAYAPILFRIALILSLALAAGKASAQASVPDATSRLCEYGITLALTGDFTRAESVFMALLSRAPRDGRALNNLGNLHLWHDHPDVALEFYRAASEADSTDAGIVLNTAMALRLAGDEGSAMIEAEEGVRRAGGIRDAAALLGLPYEQRDDPLEKSSDRTRMNREQALFLLRAASRAVPRDSTVHSPTHADSVGAASRRRVPSWRSAGARGSEQNDTTPVVYWKR
jgi:Flp pilus assembly protein TadD